MLKFLFGNDRSTNRTFGAVGLLILGFYIMFSNHETMIETLRGSGYIIGFLWVLHFGVYLIQDKHRRESRKELTDLFN